MTVSLVGNLAIPPDFPADAIDAVNSLAGKMFDSQKNGWTHFGGGWRAMTYRYLACAEHDAQFTALLQEHGESPVQPYRYQQERELFGFFINGQSAIESLCYGLYALGHMVDSAAFELASDDDARKVSVAATSKQFGKSFFGTALSRELKALVKDRRYKQWTRVRNILTHRSQPGRTFYETGQYKPADWFEGVTIDADTTPSRREWLSQTMAAIITATEAFLTEQQPLLAAGDAGSHQP